MNYKEVFKDILYCVEQLGDSEEIVNICSNSKKIGVGDTFLAIVGIKTDGHKYIESAINSGAKVIICNKDKVGTFSAPKDVSVFSVEDTRTVFSKIANNYYQDPTSKFRLVGVTGTNGKTSTTTMVDHVFRSLGYNTALIGTINIYVNGKVLDIERTTPTTPDCLELGKIMSICVENKVDYVFMEASSMAMKLGRVRACNFHTAAFTNLSPEHLDDHKTMEDYKNSKLLLMPMAERAVVNMDDEVGAEFLEKAKEGSIGYGIDNPEKCDLYASNVKFENDRVCFDVNWQGKVWDYQIMIPSRFAVYNALAATGICLSLGLCMDDIRKYLCEKFDIAGRYEVIKGKKITAIIDFAHTGVALENLLTSVRQNKSYKRIISVFGCGGDRDNSKRSVMGNVSQRLADYSVITMDNPRTEDPNRIVGHILEGVDKSVANYEVEHDRDLAIRKAIEMAEDGDVVVISGKGHETEQIFNGYTVEFNDKIVAEKYIHHFNK